MLIKQKTNSNGARARVNILTAALLTAGLAFSALPANAYIPSSDEVKIRINAVDLESDFGIERVYAYIVSQAEDACEQSSRTTVGINRFEKTCTAKLLTSFVEDIDNEKLTTYHKRQLAS